MKRRVLRVLRAAGCDTMREVLDETLDGMREEMRGVAEIYEAVTARLNRT